jgi:hypothetical protein
VVFNESKSFNTSNVKEVFIHVVLTKLNIEGDQKEILKNDKPLEES